MQQTDFLRLPDLQEEVYLLVNDGRILETVSLVTEILQICTRPDLPEFIRNNGNAMHCVFTAMGHLMLSHGQTNTAKQCLLASVCVPTSPQLATFGPKMTLARKLFDLGERECVLTFLTGAKNLWILGDRRLQEAIEAISNGERPLGW